MLRDTQSRYTGQRIAVHPVCTSLHPTLPPVSSVAAAITARAISLRLRAAVAVPDKVSTTTDDIRSGKCRGTRCPSPCKRKPHGRPQGLGQRPSSRRGIRRCPSNSQMHSWLFSASQIKWNREDPMKMKQWKYKIIFRHVFRIPLPLPLALPLLIPRQATYLPLQLTPCAHTHQARLGGLGGLHTA